MLATSPYTALFVIDHFITIDVTTIHEYGILLNVGDTISIKKKSRSIKKIIHYPEDGSIKYLLD